MQSAGSPTRAWFHPVEADVTFNRRLGTVVASMQGDQARATRSEPPQGADAEHPLAASIPVDAVAAAAVHDGATVFASLPFAAELKDGLGLETATLAAAAPGDAALYARSGVPAATVTLLATSADRAGARRIVAELAPNVAGVPGTVGGVAATDVSLGPVDLFYGKVGRTIFVTDDPGATLTPQAHLARAGGPAGRDPRLGLSRCRARAAGAREPRGTRRNTSFACIHRETELAPHAARLPHAWRPDRRRTVIAGYTRAASRPTFSAYGESSGR